MTVDWKAVAFVAAGLVANVLLIEPLGFTAASTVLFVLVALRLRQPQAAARCG